jgi:argininosuccinate lyase
MASLCAGRCDAVLTALHNTPFTDINDNEHTTHGEGYEALAMAERVLTLMTGVVRSAGVDEARARANIERSFATITELADTLAREERTPFVQAHQVAAGLARAMQASGETLSNVPYATFAAVFEKTTGRAPGLTEARFRQVVTPDYFIAVRTLPGGPAPAALAESQAIYRKSAETARARLAAHGETQARADASLTAAARRYRT